MEEKLKQRKIKKPEVETIDKITMGIFLILVIAGLAVCVLWTKNNSVSSKDNQLIIEILAYDYIRIDGIAYPTKDISRIDIPYAAQYATMWLNDDKVVVHFNTGEFVLYNEGDMIYGTD